MKTDFSKLPMKLILVVAALLPVSAVWSKQDPKMDVTDIALCTAAAMKSGQGIEVYRRWSSALLKRYQVIYPNYSTQQLDAYTAERTLDKRKELERRGIHTRPAFQKFLKENCEPFAPF
jgi:hypothetical protein